MSSQVEEVIRHSYFLQPQHLRPDLTQDFFHRSPCCDISAWCIEVRSDSNECPPKSKKLSVTPTFSSPNTSAQISHRISSTAVRAATYPPGALRSGRGKACRSIFPLVFNGIRCNLTNTDGTIYSGNLSLRYALSSWVPTSSFSTR